MFSFSSIGKLLPFLRVVFIFRLLGRGFFLVPDLVRVVKKYVAGDDHENVNDEIFVAETENLLYLCPSFLSNAIEDFKYFHEFSIEEGHPLGSILVSPREKCRKCGRDLSSDRKRNVVVVYHSELGSYLGSRISKCCKKCKIIEHYGYWTFGGIRRYDENCFELPFLLVSEDTAIDFSLLKQCANLLVVGAVPFSTFASSYNRRFGYNKSISEEPEEELCQLPKRLKREKSDDFKLLLKQRKKLDRRRLEEGFLLFASLETVMKHDIDIHDVPCDKTELVEAIVGEFHKSFVKKWGDHLCNTPGCQDIVVLDGNMKNARQVCACRNVGNLTFSGLNGSVVIGCKDTPAKGSRYCKEHTGFGTTFRDDSVNEQDDNSKEKNEKEEDGSLIISFLNEKCTRTEKFYEVLWSDGRKSWVKERNLPKKIRECMEKGQKYAQEVVKVKEFGQERIELKHSYKDEGSKESPLLHFSSFGFGVEDSEDNMVEDENGKKKKLSCGTEKGKHKSKNNKTAGILVVEKPCGVVVDVRELFGSESKTQVYAHLHNLLEKPVMKNTSVICYDDACHLKKFATNPTRCDLTQISQKMATMHMMCDKFHFKNHVDAWCKKNCNPYKCTELKKVNTEVCEQLFSWLSRFSHITKHMNRWRFLFLMLYVLDCHNEDVEHCVE